MSRLIYHYHATIQLAVGTLTNLDGLLLRAEGIQTGGDYKAVKQAIAETENIDVNKLTITSLSFLGYESAPTVNVSMSNWQPMQSAPRDGSLFLAHFSQHPSDSPFHHFKRTERFAVVWWGGDLHGWVMPGLSGLMPELWMPIIPPERSRVPTGGSGA